MFIIWKASVTEYRVRNSETNEVQILENFTAVDCEFKVDVKQYELAKKNNFQNSGDANDFFAWIEAVTIARTETALDKKVFYNPFKSCNFVDRVTNDCLTSASKVVIEGNTLSYE